MKRATGIWRILCCMLLKASMTLSLDDAIVEYLISVSGSIPDRADNEASVEPSALTNEFEVRRTHNHSYVEFSVNTFTGVCRNPGRRSM